MADNKEVRKFVKEKETKRTIKYEEETPSGEAPISGSFYLKKHVVEQMGGPDEIEVTVEPR